MANRAVEPPPPGWTPELLDVPAYLDRLSLHRLPEPTAVGLRQVHAAHIASIPFENLDVVTGLGVDVALPAVQAKLVGRRRGGYCFEHNTLFAAALERAGFTVTRLAARVRMGVSFVRPRTHMALVVRADGRDWLADVGFGGDGLLEPVPLEDGLECRQGAWTNRVLRVAEGWVLQARRPEPDGWLDLYSLALDPQHPIDYVMANHFTSTHPLSSFTHTVTVQRPASERRLVLRGRTLTDTHVGGTTDQRDVGAGELDDLLRERFGLALSAGELEAVQERWPQG
jgi:N-hydroxyarylamine O-acetyltransferase